MAYSTPSRSFLFSNISRNAIFGLGANIRAGASVQWVSVALFLSVKRPGRGADHSPPSSAEVKTAWNYASTPSIRLHSVVLS
jgi:hypothetical protein